jgi:peptidyl-prolyl cis-trans isomerase D
MGVTDVEVADEYRRRNEKVKLDVVPITPDAFKSQVTVTDADLAAQFDKNKESYRIGEKRKMKYALVDVDAVRAAITVPDAEAEAFYDQNRQQYTTEAQVRASHILFKTEGKDENAVRTQAESVLKRARSGEDFAALAKQYSEDDSNKDKGGDLDYFGKGRMVPEFEAAAFAMKNGDISELVKTQFGFHIIKVVDNQPEVVRPLEQVKTEIVDQLRWQKAQQAAEAQAKTLASDAKTPADLERLARERNIEFRESGLFSTTDPIDALGPQPELATTMFGLKEGEVSKPQRVARGWVVGTVTGRQEPYVPTIDEVKDKVREDVVRDKAAGLAKERAAAIAADLKTAKDFAATAKKHGLDVKPTELIARGSAIPDIGMNEDVDKAAFSLPVNGVSDPITTPGGTAIIRVTERQDVTEAQIASGRDDLREEMNQQRRDRFFSAYMQKAKAGLKININQDVFAQVLGPAPSPGLPPIQ